MKKYLVWCNEIDYLLSEEIEAESVEQAKQKYLEKWEAGDIAVNETELVNWQITEIGGKNA